MPGNIGRSLSRCYSGVTWQDRRQWEVDPWLSPFLSWLTDSQPHSAASIVTVAGVGIDMLIYASLVLAFRVDPKVAIPTSVLAMAFNSVLGLAIQQGTTGIEAGVWGNWLAAAPVVVLGASLGLVGMAGACVAVLLCVYALDRLQAWGETRAAA